MTTLILRRSPSNVRCRLAWGCICCDNRQPSLWRLDPVASLSYSAPNISFLLAFLLPSHKGSTDSRISATQVSVPFESSL
ncbi:hypothetical protein RRG08_013441 [Elysia crispata]|uniref:Uncharacterized protein n=1 Tax=Elysia crispata TaxID=231223 RepID=A0AAE0ZNK0_9GAST|nr:hypothetical protein RRG08_013441 [Elysia crispata]